jgi:transcription initiation factor TFIIIB Brf1 subunit/transcription initiation factor TFIIB
MKPHCPVCNSQRTLRTKTEFVCYKCGYVCKIKERKC